MTENERLRDKTAFLLPLGKAPRIPCPSCDGDSFDGPQAHQWCGTCGGAGTVPATQECGRPGADERAANRMADEELDGIEAVANTATPGPWQWDDTDCGCPVVVTKASMPVAQCYDGPTADAAFIACARTDVPKLVAEVRRLRAVTDAAKALAAKLKHAEHCPGNRHLDCGPGENEAWCCVWCRAQEECLRRKADCDCHIAAWRELLGVPVAREDGR